MNSRNGRSATETSISGRVMVSDLRVYPNPFNQQLNVQLDLQAAGDVSIVLYDMRGRQVLTQSFDGLDQGVNRVVIQSVSKMTDGMYIYQIQTQDDVKTGQVQYRQ